MNPKTKKPEKNYVQELKNKLNLIGFDIKGTYPNRFIYNNLGRKTDWWVLDDRIELINDDVFGNEFKGSVCFFFKRSEIKKISRDCISVGNEYSFVNFENFDIKEK